MRSLIWILFMLAALLSAQHDEFFEAGTTVGGYGELHYNVVKAPGEKTSKTLDFHRFVLFLNHNWTEKFSFKSELEVEHNLVEGDRKTGEVSLEQAYVDYHHSDLIGLQAGVILLPVGLINPFHEPPLFFSVERPDYSKYIIPTTWAGNGLTFYGRYKGLEYRFSAIEGLNGANFSRTNGIRKGRQKGYMADASSLLYSLSFDYTAIPGLRVGFSSTYNEAFVTSDISLPVSLNEGHFQYRHRHLMITGEFGQINYNGDESGFSLKKAYGYYIDLGYNVAPALNLNGELTPWFRYTSRDMAAETVNGASDGKNRFDKWLAGISFKPIPEVVYKAEFGGETLKADQSTAKLFNLGIGYMF